MAEILSNFTGFGSTRENLHDIPIRLKQLPTTGALAGDDGGYRDVPVEDLGDPLVKLDDHVMTRPSYDGIDEVTGTFDQSLVLPGGVEGGGIYARVAVLESLNAANSYLASRYPGMQIGVIDGFRSVGRQSAGFSRKTIEVLAGNMNPDIITLYRAGVTADGTFSFVQASRHDPLYAQFVQDMTIDSGVILLADELGQEPQAVARELADISANLRYTREQFPATPYMPLNMDLRLNSNNNAHAGGGAVDLFLYDEAGRMLNGHVPFDYMGPEAAMDFLELDDGFGEFRERVKDSPLLQAHLEKQGITSDITESQWELWKASQRIIYHVMVRSGATFFTDTAVNRMSDNFFGGENWHFEPGNIVRDPANGRFVYVAPSARVVWDGGNPGHTLQKRGRNVAAPWGGDAAHADLIRRGVLVG